MVGSCNIRLWNTQEKLNGQPSMCKYGTRHRTLPQGASCTACDGKRKGEWAQLDGVSDKVTILGKRCPAALALAPPLGAVSCEAEEERSTEQRYPTADGPLQMHLDVNKMQSAGMELDA